MFSLKKEYNELEGKPIGFFVGGVYDKKVLYAYKGRKNYELFAEIDISKHEHGKIKPIHNVDGNDVVYFCGSSGSGKTTMAAEYILSFLKQHPKWKVYIISRIPYKEDPALSHLKMIQLDIDEPIDFVEEEYEDCLFFFDDVLNLTDKAKRDNVEKLIIDLLENARKSNVSVFLTSHIINPQNKMARIVLNEVKSLVVFPESASAHQLKYALNKYFNMSNQKIKKVIDSDSRYVVVSRTCPNYCLEEQKAYMANDQDCK